MVVSEALFSVSVGYFWSVGIGGALFWVDGGDGGWVHCLIMLISKNRVAAALLLKESPF